MLQNFSSNCNRDEAKRKNELGCETWASACILTKDGTLYYVDNTEDNIREQMNSKNEFIEVELAKIISDRIKRIPINKEKIKEFYSVNIRKKGEITCGKKL